MIQTLAISNYRSIGSLALPLADKNLLTGPNRSGKSDLYGALRLQAEIAQGGVASVLARERGFWAGPEQLSRSMRKGESPI
jgi:predicted ATPase